MYSNQNLQGLPVNPMEVDGSFYTQTIPNLPPLQLGRMQQFAESIIAASIQELQNRASQNPLRTFLFNLMSQHGWVNPNFEMLLGTVARTAEYMIQVKQMQPQQGIGTAATEVCTMLSCVMVSKFPPLQQIVDQQHVNEVKQQITRFQALEQELNQFEQLLRQQNTGNNWNNNQGGGWQNTNNGPAVGSSWGNNNAGWQGNNRGPATGRQNQPSNYHGRASMWSDSNSNASTASTSQFQTIGSGFNTGIHNVGEKKLVEEKEFSMAPSNNQATGVRADATAFPKAPGSGWTKTTTSPNNDQSKTADTRQWKSISTQHEWPKVIDPTRPYDALLFEDGSELRPAVTSGWTVTASPGELPQPTPVFDQIAKILFHLRKSDGSVAAVIKKRTKDMDYLSNELDPVMREHYKRMQAMDPERRVEADQSLLQSFRPAHQKAKVAASEEKLAVATEELKLGEGETLTLDSIQTSSFADGVVKARLIADSDESEMETDSELEFVVDVTSMVPGHVSMIKHIEGLGAITDYGDFITELTLLQGENTLSAEVYEKIKAQATAGINDFLTHSLLLPNWSIDSLVADYKDLVDTVNAKYGDSGVKLLKQSARTVIPAACFVLKGADLGRYFTQAGVTSDKVVVFAERRFYRDVVWSLAEFQAQYQLEGIVTASEAPAMHEGLELILQNADQYRPYSKLLLLTSDRQQVDVRVSPFTSAAYLLRVDGPLDR